MDYIKRQAYTDLSIAKGNTLSATSSAIANNATLPGQLRISPAALQRIVNHMADGVISPGELAESRRMLNFASRNGFMDAARNLTAIVSAEENQLAAQTNLAAALVSPDQRWGGQASIPEPVIEYPRERVSTAEAVGIGLGTALALYGATKLLTPRREEHHEHEHRREDWRHR